MQLVRVVVVALVMVVPLAAQEPVRSIPDGASYAAAAINPAMAAIEAARSADRWCRLSQLGLSELVGNGLGILGQRFIVSPRPCLGCSPHGSPSLHGINATIGISMSWPRGAAAAATTLALRHEANRHTWLQLAEGFGVGLLAEWTGHLVKCGA